MNLAYLVDTDWVVHDLNGHRDTMGVKDSF